MRIHHWIKSDDTRYFHDHSSDLLSVVLKGTYYNVKPIDPDKNPSNYVDCGNYLGHNTSPFKVEGIFNSVHIGNKPLACDTEAEARARHGARLGKGLGND